MDNISFDFIIKKILSSPNKLSEIDEFISKCLYREGVLIAAKEIPQLGLIDKFIGFINIFNDDFEPLLYNNGNYKALTPKQLENLVSGVSSATMSKAVAQPTLNAPQNSGVDTLGASDSIKQIQNLYSAAMRDITLEKARAEAQKPSDKTSTDIPEEFTNALGKFDIIPLSASIDNLAKQVNTSSTDQQSLLSRQIDKLSELVSAMQDNVRYNERIANELG